MDNLAADFTIENNNPFEVEYELSENKSFDCSFTIFANPEKISQLENDLNFQTGEQVEASISAASVIINERIDGVVEAFDNEIEDINERMIDTIEGSELIGVLRTDNAVTLVSQTLVFEQGIASDTWVIEHNLGKKPSVTVVDSADSVIGIFKADYDGKNKVTLKFNGAFAGKAYLN